ncbi:hypothetical protein V5O48_005828 [Marasmius crinis-equi]|uniref:Uncharacterized protein n=1 Tax=Marasmius crinis-equi TaxID=585013 RepID=A0ABR3FL61_9AGAR
MVCIITEATTTAIFDDAPAKINTTPNSISSTGSATVVPTDTQASNNKAAFNVESLVKALERYLQTSSLYSTGTYSTSKLSTSQAVLAPSSDPIYKILRDAGLRGIWQSLMAEPVLPWSLPDSASPPTTDDQGQDLGFLVVTEVSNQAWSRLRAVSSLVIAATNGLDVLGVQGCPISIPNGLFTSSEWRSVIAYVDPITRGHRYFPICSATNPAVQNPFYHAIFPLRNYAQSALECLEMVLHILVQWTVAAITRSLCKGCHSLANFGSLFGITQEETLHHLNPRNYDNRYPNRVLNAQGDIVAEGLELILHPQHSTAVLHRYLEEYNPH